MTDPQARRGNPDIPADLIIDTMTPAEVDQVLVWAEQEGWLPGPADAAVFRSADPEGFLAARLAGTMLAGVSVVRFGPGFAFLGLFICQPQWRGRGIGGRLIRAGLALAGPRVVGLDGVIAQQSFYGRLGLRTAHRHVRYGGSPPARVSASPPGVTLTWGARADLRDAVAFDAAHFPGDRRRFMSAWLDPQQGRRWILARAGGEVVGLGAIRPAPPGHKVGPLQAASPQVAAAVFDRLTEGVAAEVYLDVPDVNLAAVELVTERAMVASFECARMYLGPTPQVPLERIYGVATLELG